MRVRSSRLGNLWELGPGGGLVCTHTWRSPLSGLEELEEQAASMPFRPGQGLVGFPARVGERVLGVSSSSAQ